MSIIQSKNLGLEGSPWANEEQLAQELEHTWYLMKKYGIKKGVITEREDGAFVGRGDPNKWFDTIEEDFAMDDGS